MQEFWDQDAWKDDESDYSSEAEQKDVFDSDFNESESDDDAEGEEAAAEKELRRAERADRIRESAAAGSTI